MIDILINSIDDDVYIHPHTINTSINNIVLIDMNSTILKVI